MNDGWTPLYTASKNGHLGVVELLSAAGANKNITCMSYNEDSLFNTEHPLKLPKCIITEILLHCYLYRFLQQPLKPLNHANWKCPLVSQLSKNYFTSFPCCSLPHQPSYVFYTPTTILFFILTITFTLSRSHPCCPTQ